LLERNNIRITCWRAEKVTCRSTILEDFKNILYADPYLYNAFVENKAKAQFTSKDTGSSIIFEGGDSIGKVLGMTQTISFFNEITEFNKDVYLQITQRTSETIFVDYNPSKSFWLDSYRHDARTIFIHSTYLDNPFCPPEIVTQLNSYNPNIPENVTKGTANEYMYRVYCLGEKAEKPNRVFNGWLRCSDKYFDNLEYQSYFGLDFGTSSPTGIVEVKYDGDKTFFVKQLLYKPSDTMEMPLYEYIRTKIKRISDDSLIVCDSAKRALVDDLRHGGLLAVGALKGAGSIDRRITQVQSFKIVYTTSSTDVDDEYFSYTYKTDRYGLVTDEVDPRSSDHLMDAIGYIISYLISYLDIKY
jgi:PBSX family phage terminase large subunit